MSEAGEWEGRVGRTWADEWRQTDRSFSPVTERLLDCPATRGFAAALDIGCGAGELACRLARGNPDSAVTGVDVSPDLLAVARARCPQATFVEADAARFLPEGPAPDLLISRHGVMFFADPVAAFGHLAAIAASGAALRFSCFRARPENVWATKLGGIFPGAPPPDSSAPGPFAFGDPAHVASILESAGWRDASFEAFDYSMLAGEGNDAVNQALAYFQRIGPAARAMAELGEGERASPRARLRELLENNCSDGRVALPAAVWIVTARAAG